MKQSLKNKEILEITDAAVKEIKNLLASKPQDVAGIRVSVRKGGCSGLAYEIEFAEEAKPFEQIVQKNGVQVFIDPKAVLFLIGSTMDYIDETFKSGFVFVNPNEKGKCGCGESFRV